MMASASHVWKTVRPHIPLIKFRKGGTVNKKAVTPEFLRGQTAVSSGGYMDETHLPPKYSRKPIDQYEIDYINRGGPE